MKIIYIGGGDYRYFVDDMGEHIFRVPINSEPRFDTFDLTCESAVWVKYESEFRRSWGDVAISADDAETAIAEYERQQSYYTPFETFLAFGKARKL